MGQGLGGASTCLLIATAGAIVSYIPIGQIASKIGRKRTIQCGIILLAVCFASGYVLTTTFSSINAIMFVVFALVGLAWAAINVNSLPMVVEMCKGSDIGKFTSYYYTASMAAQVVTPIVAGTLMRKIDYRVLVPVCCAVRCAELCDDAFRPPRRCQGRGQEGAGGVRGNGRLTPSAFGRGRCGHPPTELRRIRTALQILNAKRFYHSNHSKAAVIKLMSRNRRRVGKTEKPRRNELPLCATSLIL